MKGGVSKTTMEEVLAGAVERLRTRTSVVGREPGRASLRDRMEALHVPAVSLAVWDGGGGITTAAWGEADPDALFQAASISKPVTAVAVMALVRQGMLGLDAEVNDLLRSWQVPSGDGVTIRRLLSHTAGLGVHGFPGYRSGDPVPSLVEILDGVPPANTEAVRVVRPPGEAAQYSGGGYTVLQLVIEETTRSAFHEVMQEVVLDPLEMTASTFGQPLPASFEARAAPGHDGSGTVVPGRWHTYPEQAAAGLWTTPADLLRAAAEAANPGRVLDVNHRDLMLSPHGDAHHGLGWMLDGEYFQHGGSNAGYRCQLYASVDGHCGAAVMTNGDAGVTLASDVLATLAEAFGWPGFLREREAVELSAAQRAGVVGAYTVAPGVDLQVAENDGVLTMTLPGVFEGELFAASEEEFFVTAIDATFQFDSEEILMTVSSTEMRFPRADR